MEVEVSAPGSLTVSQLPFRLWIVHLLRSVLLSDNILKTSFCIYLPNLHLLNFKSKSGAGGHCVTCWRQDVLCSVKQNFPSVVVCWCFGCVTERAPMSHAKTMSERRHEECEKAGVERKRKVLRVK